MMQDRKALQAGTSHFLGQNFSKAAGIKFLDQAGKQELAWTTSWGVSTRLIGGVIMAHGDDDGLMLPPRLAPTHVVILPVLHKEETRAKVLEYCQKLRAELRAVRYADQPLEVELDVRDLRGGDKVWQWVKKGVPLIVEVGPRDMDKDCVFWGRRDRGPKNRTSTLRAEFVATVSATLEEMQKSMLERARAFRTENTRKLDTKEDIYAYFTPKNADKPEIHGGFALAHWSGDPAVEDQLAKDLKVTIRCVPIDTEGELAPESGVCPFTGKPSARRVVLGKAY
jgi:prolyl-tRNA synthetase